MLVTFLNKGTKYPIETATIGEDFPWLTVQEVEKHGWAHGSRRESSKLLTAEQIGSRECRLHLRPGIAFKGLPPVDHFG